MGQTKLIYFQIQRFLYHKALFFKEAEKVTDVIILKNQFILLPLGLLHSEKYK